MVRLAGVILTFNEAQHVKACVDSLRWADRVVVFDSHSQDETRALARDAGAEVMTHTFENYAQQRNAALERVDAEWILFVDADERVTPELAEEVQRVIVGSESQYRGWWVPRHNYIFGKLTKHAGWYPDHQMRLLHRASARYDPTREVHELVQLEGEAGFLESVLVHYNYDDLADFHARQDRYTDYEARIQFEAGERPKPYTLFTQPLRHFLWRFVTLRGYRDGLHGLRLSLLMAYYNFEKWRRIVRLARTARHGIAN